MKIYSYQSTSPVLVHQSSPQIVDSQDYQCSYLFCVKVKFKLNSSTFILDALKHQTFFPNLCWHDLPRPNDA